ncbi:MAG: type II toxin-antitoxin system HicB family antitoxin [Ruminococcus sp.]|nr:type II toxin-antitoxin system HicB family antitoxin [Ruminococcus sp.]
MKRVYPVVFIPDGEWYLVNIPDFDIQTQGKGLADAIDMARDAIELMGVELEDENETIPTPSDISTFKLKKGQICTLIDCDFDEYRKMLDNRSVKKNCTLPSWLNKQAEAAHINFSAVLQEALINKLGIQK